jgi:hypothetical protein
MPWTSIYWLISGWAIIFYGIPFAISMSRWFVYKRLYLKKSFFELLFGVFFTCFREKKSDQATVNNDFDKKRL